jgi:LuxR family maltose regulon positive regulatory protein
MNALHSLLSYFAVDPEKALICAQQSIAETPRELWIARILARLFMAVSLQMRGDTSQAYAAIYRGFEEEKTQTVRFKATLVMTVCHLHWITTNLQGMAQTAKESIKLSQDADMPEILNFAYFHLGQVCYQQNDLAAAERHFATVVQQPYLNYGDCYAHSACGLALTHQIQGRPDEAQAVLEAAGAFMLETGNTTMMPLIQAFQAEIALRQGHLAEAGRWAALLDPIPPFQPVYGFFSPHLTLVKIWLAQDTPASRQQAADLLEDVRGFFETTHNTRFLIDALALQALLNEAQGQFQTALAALKQALALAQPGGFIRLFVDLGPPLARLLAEFKPHNNDMSQYVDQILAAFEEDEGGRRQEEKDNIQPSAFSIQPLIEPLTNRELDIVELLAQRLSNQEIADRLFISPHTVKTHNKNIFAKLNVKNRRQAIARARELGLIPSE